MQAIATESAFTQKTRELCAALLEEPEVGSIRTRVDAFMNDDKARAQYDVLMFKGQALQQKQQMGMPLTNEEIADFEGQRDTLMKNAVVTDFLQAQKEMQKLQDSVLQYVSKTIELGRVPEASDIETGCCDSGCGCH